MPEHYSNHDQGREMPQRFYQEVKANYEIFPRRGVVLFCFGGQICLHQAFETFNNYTRHPQCRPGQTIIFDLTEATGFITSYVDIMKLRAQMVEYFTNHKTQTIMVFHAPTPRMYHMSKLIADGWKVVPETVPMVQTDEEQTLEVSGQPETSFREFVSAAS